MTDDRSLERAARSFIEVGPTRAPERAVEAALLRIQTTPQQRDLRIPWRFPPMTIPARLVALAILGTLLIASMALLGGTGWMTAPSVGPTSSATAVASAETPDLVTFRSPLYGYSVAIDVGWHVRPATDRWLGSEPPHQSDPPFADRFDGAGSSAERTVLIKARELDEGTTPADWMAQWEETREVVGQCFGTATRWMDRTVADMHARRLAWRCDSAASDRANYDEYTVVADGTAFVITGSPSMVAAVLESIQLPDSAPSPTRSPSSAPSTAVASAVPALGSRLIAFERHVSTTTTIWVEREDGSDSHELLPDIAGSNLIGRVPDPDQVLVTLAGDEVLMAFVDVVDGEIHAIPKDCPSADCWADSASVYGSGRHGVSLSIDGRQAAMVLSDKALRTAVIGIVDLATGSTSLVESTRVRIGESGGGLSDPRLSPDGRTIAYLLLDARFDPRKCLSGAAALMVVDRFDGSAPRRLVSSDRCPSDPVWSPSGADIAFTSDDVTNTAGSSPGELIAHEHHDVYVVSVPGGKLRRLTTDRTSSLAAWTADGRISFAVLRDRSAVGEGMVLDVWIVDPDTSHRTRLKRTLGALGDAGCLSCAFLWSGSIEAVGLWPRD